MSVLNQAVVSTRGKRSEQTLAIWASLLFAFAISTLLISIAASEAFLVASLIAYIFDVLGARQGRGSIAGLVAFPPVKIPLALFCLFSVISIYWAENSAVGWLAVRKFVLFGIWLLAVNLIASARRLTYLYWALFLEAGSAGVVGAVQFGRQYHSVRALHPDRVYSYMTLERIHGFMGHWMNFSGQQMLVFCALLSFMLLAARRIRNSRPGVRDSEELRTASLAEPFSRNTSPESRALGWFVLAIVALSILLSLTRGVWLGCFAAALYVAARWRPRWMVALPVLLAAAYLVAPPLARKRVQVLIHPMADPSLSIRFEMWDAGLRMIRKHPWVGVGPGNIVEVYTLYLPPGKAPEVGYHEHLHNDYLQLAAERGLPCLAAWLWLMGALAWNFWRIRRRYDRNSRVAWVSDAALAAWLAFLVEGCFEFNFGTSPVLMVFLFIASTPFVAEKLEKAATSGD